MYCWWRTTSRSSASSPRSLTQNGFEVEAALDGEEGLAKARAGGYDAIVLDLQLPKLNGLDVCRRLRDEHNSVPIIMLTARSGVPDRIAGLDAGADDYLTKPFSLGELAARLRALGRRGAPERRGAGVGRPGARRGAREVRVDDDPVELTGTEFALLEYLMRNPGQVLSRDQLREEVWGAGFEPASNVVDIYVHYVRRKLKAAGMHGIRSAPCAGWVMHSAERTEDSALHAGPDQADRVVHGRAGGRADRAGHGALSGSSASSC